MAGEVIYVDPRPSLAGASPVPLDHLSGRQRDALEIWDRLTRAGACQGRVSILSEPSLTNEHSAIIDCHRPARKTVLFLGSELGRRDRVMVDDLCGRPVIRRPLAWHFGDDDEMGPCTALVLPLARLVGVELAVFQDAL